MNELDIKAYASGFDAARYGHALHTPAKYEAACIAYEMGYWAAYNYLNPETQAFADRP